jgi:ubiquinone/menaquinone biosynthesis C-methylase UbiE
MDGKALGELLEQSGATVMQATPSTWRLLLSSGWRGSPRLTILCGGEQWPKELAQELLGRCKSLWNMYGPTETTIWSAALQIKREDEVLIGGPVANTQFYIVDRQLRPAPVGVPGELCIGGDGLACGYLNRAELTAEKFPANPFENKPGARLYRTGDMVRYREGGQIEFLGRLDHQVKIRGFRIEPGEIEATLMQHPAVKTAVVVPVEGNAGDTRLAAYLVPDEDYGKTEEPGAYAECITSWQSIWDNTYKSADPQDASFNIAGWRSSYDGRSISPEEMREWVDETVKRILATGPKRILELGCGTGLLLFRIAPSCDYYCGTDFSATALDSIRKELDRRVGDLSGIKLLQRRVDELDDFVDESFDAVVLNSVIQYFPSIDYLVKVLDRVSRLVKPGGAIFLGDVRNFNLQQVFCASVQVRQAPSELPISELRHRIRKQMAQEEELLIAPEFFFALKRDLPRLGDVEIQLKRGKSRNEMTLFRYDVVLRVGSPSNPNGDLEALDWQGRGLTVETFREHLGSTKSGALLVRSIPINRLQPELKLMESLAHEDEKVTVSALREAAAQPGRGGGVEPEELWSLGESLGFSVRVAWSNPNSTIDCDAVFVRNGNRAAAINNSMFGEEKAGAQERAWNAYSNQPLQGARARKLVPTLRDYLKGKMPSYMVPSDYILLERMPLTPNGKQDRKALPASNPGHPEVSGQYVPPHTPMEQVISEIWARELNLEKAGVHDNFFDLGGHSLLLVRVQAKVCEALRTDVSIVEMFQYPTISSLARHLSEPPTVSLRLKKVQERVRHRPRPLGRRKQIEASCA